MMKNVIYLKKYNSLSLESLLYKFNLTLKNDEAVPIIGSTLKHASGVEFFVVGFKNGSDHIKIMLSNNTLHKDKQLKLLHSYLKDKESKSYNHIKKYYVFFNKNEIL